jgi:hypothetical protein
MTNVVVCGALANKPDNGGEAWVRLSWVRGLQRLGFDVWFAEELAPARNGEREPDADIRAAAWFTRVLNDFDLLERSVLLQGERVIAGGSALQDQRDVRDLFGSAALVIDISGTVRSPYLLSAAARSAYVDLDPGYTQIWLAQGVELGLGRYDLHFTVGEGLAEPSCPLPTGGLTWLPCRQPVLLDDWPVLPLPAADDAAFTTITTWRCPFGQAEWAGEIYGAKHHEFRSLIELPSRIDVPIELAVAMHPADSGDRERFVAAGWSIRDAADVASDPFRFRSYVQSSRGELSAAQGVYVHTGSGWFSDRTARYLASGRPAVVQDTGIAARLPTGDGLLTFTDLSSAIDALESALASPEHHAVAARQWAEAHLDATTVLADFVERCGVTP